MTTKKVSNPRPKKAERMPWDQPAINLQPGQEKKTSVAAMKKEIKNWKPR